MWREEFYRIDACKEWLLKEKIVSESKKCEKCNGSANLIDEKDQLFYKCTKKECKSKKPIYDAKIKTPLLMSCVRLIFFDCDDKIFIEQYGITKVELEMLRNSVQQACCTFMEKNPIVFGGEKVSVEVDELVLCPGQVIRNPTEKDDKNPKSQFFLFIVDSGPEKLIHIEPIPNRKPDSIKKALKNRIAKGSILTTDEFESYKEVAKDLSLQHRPTKLMATIQKDGKSRKRNIVHVTNHLKGKIRNTPRKKLTNVELWMKMYSFTRMYRDRSCTKQGFRKNDETFENILREF